LLQILLPGQDAPQAEQLSLSVSRFTQFPAGQRVNPAAHAQLPALHISVLAGQPRLHVPQ
jgi:hypothetical protein